MQKKKVYDVENSNIAMLGSEAEKKCREVSSGKEKAWKNAGKKVGLQIWRIEQFKVVPWPKNQYGEFFDGDSYIVLSTYEEKDTEVLRYDLHYWLGTDTSQDEAGTAAYKTVELDDHLGGAAVQYRQICRRENSLFLSYFTANGGIRLLHGGAESGFNHVEPESYKPRLLHLKGRKNVRINQCELKGDSLTSGDCYILDAGLMIYQWQGKNSNTREKTRAHQYAVGLVSDRNGKPKIEVIDQEDTQFPDGFWDILGGQPDEIKDDDGDDDEWEKKSEKIMFELSDENGSLTFTEVAKGKRCTLQVLKSDNVFIIDIGSELFIWVGKGASQQEKAKAMKNMMNYMEEYDRPKWLPITKILEGSETSTFIDTLKPKAKRSFRKSTGGPTVEQKGSLGCYLTADDASNGSLYLNWKNGEVDNNLAFFLPTKSVPKFKLKKNGGKEELTRGTAVKKKNLYQGWCNFVKLGKGYKSTFSYSSEEVKVYSLEGSKITFLERGESYDLTKVDVVAVIPGTSKVYDGLKSIDKGTFIGKAQSKGGALPLSKGK